MFKKECQEGVIAIVTGNLERSQAFIIFREDVGSVLNEMQEHVHAGVRVNITLPSASLAGKDKGAFIHKFLDNLYIAVKLKKNMFSSGVSNPYAVQAQLVKHAQRRLESKVGRKYKEVVIKCLTGDFGVADDTREDLKLQQAFRHQVVDVIEMAASNV
ncbi:hypothetical protein ASPZODRAFT_2109037 [Penicilliopsis zonata CBS 506.65]|uniref:Uncharacterized protein n=1 Tax=Penicilliopsis zonata CBS 506.65 TaxID=1073090 RepID=A0A1L9SF51_9EURO|nr:hypothetical protein ASPZODRAFT_2109037 [Penicilliopsis zonata CBS 506.65]OJJ45799.1 hypothetical protein ASPZODRAFT_2109037 [Penicilliopsis zonata CBS 506.65]